MNAKISQPPAAVHPPPVVRPPKPFEPEGQFILRLPEPAAELVRIALSTQKDMLKERLKIDMQPDMRRAKVYVDSMEFHAKLVDLPCVVESHKTMDRKTFYKTGDVCQVGFVALFLRNTSFLKTSVFPLDFFRGGRLQGSVSTAFELLVKD